MYLVSINNVEEVSQKIKTTAYLKLVWSDTFMKWEPSDFGNITEFYLPQNELWKPDIALANAYDTISGLGAPFMYVVVTNDGNITWEPFQVFESTCKLDMRYFPFDTHKCNLELATWSSTSEMIQISPGNDGFDIDAFEENANFYLDIVSTFDSSSTFTSSLSFSLTIRRKPIYYIINVIIPIIFLAVLNSFVFILPCASGEKLSYAIVLFLSFAIYLLIVIETMPEGMSTVPIVTIYLLFECVISAKIVVITAVLLRLHNQGDETSVPELFQQFTKSIQNLTRKVLCQSTKSVTRRNLDGDEEILLTHKINVSNSVTHNKNTERNKKTDSVLKESMYIRYLKQKLRCGTGGANSISEEIQLDNWKSIHGRVSEKTEFRLADILGHSNRVEPTAFFKKPSPVYPVYDENLALVDTDETDKILFEKGKKLEAVSSDILKMNEKEEIIASNADLTSGEKNKITWPEFVLALDSLLFVLSLITNIIAIIITFARSSAN